MTTTIRTSSQNYFNKIKKYLTNKKIIFTSSINLKGYILTIFELNEVETTSFILSMTKRLHLTNKQQEPLALAA